LGGEAPESTVDLKVPLYTDLMIYLDYIVFGLAIFGFIFFLVYQFVTNFINNPRSAIMSLGVLVGFLALLFICYAAGSDTPVANINDPDLAKYNTGGWLKIIDMWIFSLTIMLSLCLLACLAGAVKQVMDK
jgi:hypothetical protein